MESISTAMCHFHLFIEGTSAAAPDARLCFKSTSSSNTPSLREGAFRTYAEVVNSLLQIFATDHVITQTNAGLARYTEPPAMSPKKYAGALGTTSVRCGEVYGERVMKGILIERLHESFRHSFRSY